MRSDVNEIANMVSNDDAMLVLIASPPSPERDTLLAEMRAHRIGKIRETVASCDADGVEVPTMIRRLLAIVGAG